MRSHLFSGVLVAFALTACAKDPYVARDALQNTNLSVIARSPSEAVERARPRTIRLPFEGTIELSNRDPVIESDGNRSYYQLMRVHLPAAATMSLSVDAPCSCTGFTFTMLNPRILVLDSAGTVLQQSPTDFETLKNLWKHPFLRASWRATTVSAGNTYILVMTDNRGIGEPIASVGTSAIQGYRPDGTAVLTKGSDAAVVSSPVGKLQLRIALQ
ncbi:MAG TPA: hypothetical protein VF006_01210 [Longimicrobium sp.]